MGGDRRIYVGNLPPGVREREIEDLFKKYGRIEAMELKNKRGPPAFCFIEFTDHRDAEDAVRGRDGYDFMGYRIRCEFPRGVGPRGPGGRPMERGYGGGGGGGGGGYDRGGPPTRGFGGGGYGRGRGDIPARSAYRLYVSGLPPSGSWQDLKDHMRKVGDVCFAEVSRTRDGSGIVEFVNKEDMRAAIKKMDDTKFKSHEGESSYIRVSERESRSRSRSRSGSRSRSRSSSKPRRRSKSRSKSASRSKSRSSKSKSRSKSKSLSKSRSATKSPSPKAKRPKKDKVGSRSRSRSASAD